MEDLRIRRGNFDKLGNNYPKDVSVNVTQTILNDVNCYWFTPKNAIPNKIIIYLHGGVFAVGSIRSHESMVSHFAGKLRTKILFVDYALAPERPYPAANNDVLDVYKVLIATYPGYEISFIGDSAGGGLTVSAVGEMLKQGIELPHAAVFISPWISMTCENRSYEENKTKDIILNKDYVKASARDYIGSSPVEIANPENVLLSNFPPVLIMVGTNEILLDDSRNFYSAVKTIQQNATLTIYENQYHVWPLANIHSEASQQALTQMDAFLNGGK
jgi:acetyl esterase/lipase